MVIGFGGFSFCRRDVPETKPRHLLTMQSPGLRPPTTKSALTVGIMKDLGKRPGDAVHRTKGA
jgi:hypothetical protein